LTLAEQLDLIISFRKSAPVNVEGLVASLGIGLRYVSLPADVSGMIEKAGDTYVISVNAADPPTRQRFTIAHELGHYVYHRHLLGDGVEEDRAYRSIATGRYRNTNIGKREETEANKFAVNLLMPLELIDAVKRDEGMTTPEQLARRFGVSVHTMSIRLGVPYRPAQAQG
jgi:Zn-dependent peptidase ImmA (M78 family)